MKLSIILFLFSTSPLFVFGQIDSLTKSNPLIDDTYLYPIDGVTPYTLKKGGMDICAIPSNTSIS